MKVRMLLFVAAMILAATAYAQGPGLAVITYDGPALTMTCDGGGCIADYTEECYLYWDQNANGPDPSDALAIVAPSGSGRVNWNHQPINGEENGFLCGQFYFSDPALIVRGGPSGYTYYYYFKLFLECPAPDTNVIVWTSSVFAVMAGQQEVSIAGFTCVGQCAPPPPDCPADSVVIYPNNTNFPAPQNVGLCLHLDSGQIPALVCIPVFNQSNWPIFTITLGCTHEPFCYEPTCDPALGFRVVGPYWDASTTSYCMLIYKEPVGEDGCCVCFHLDYILPVGMASFTAVPRDNAVELAWETRSESDVDHFEISRTVVGREAEVVHSERATNIASGARYIWLDEGTINGTTYTYGIVAVLTDGSRSDVLNSASVTPSMKNAVVTEYALHQNFPNPFNPSTTIRFDVVEDNFVTLKIYNATGQEVATVYNGSASMGVHLATFDASNLTSGIYFYTVKIGSEFSATKKMLLVK